MATNKATWLKIFNWFQRLPPASQQEAQEAENGTLAGRLIDLLVDQEIRIDQYRSAIDSAFDYGFPLSEHKFRESFRKFKYTKEFTHGE